MYNKKLAEQILKSKNYKNIKTNSSNIKLESNIELFDSKNQKNFIKIAYNTYVKKSDLSRVWSVERINGKDFIVAIDSGIPISHNYHIRNSGSNIQVLYNDELLAEFPVSEEIDKSSLVKFLQNKLASYKFLPKNLFLTAIQNELDKGSEIFIRADVYFNKTSDNYIEKILNAKIPETAISGIEELTNSIAKRNLIKWFNESVEPLKDSDQGKELLSKRDEIVNNLLTTVLSAIKSKREEFIFKDLSFYVAEEVSQLINSFDKDLRRLLKYFFDNVNNYFVVFTSSGITPYMILISSAITGQSVTFDKAKPKPKSPGSAKREERQKEIQELESRKEKILGYIEGKSYALILDRIPEERQVLLNEINTLCDNLVSKLEIKNLRAILDPVIENFVRDPLNTSFESLTSAIKAANLQLDEPTLNALFNVLKILFNRAFFNARELFFEESGARLLSQNVLGRLFYHVSDNDLKVILEESDVDPELFGYIKDFNEFASSNDKVDVVLAKFLERHPELNTKDKIKHIIIIIIKLSKAWNKKAASTIYVNSITNSNPTNSTPSVHLANIMGDLYLWELVFNKFLERVYPDVVSEMHGTPVVDLNSLKDRKFIEQTFNSPNKKAALIYTIKCAAYGHAILLHALGLIPEKLVNTDYGESKNEVLMNALFQAGNALSLSEKLKIRNIYFPSGQKKGTGPLNFLSHKVFTELLKIDPIYISNYLKNLQVTSKDDIDFLKRTQDIITEKLQDLVKLIEDARNNKLVPSIYHANNKLLRLLSSNSKSYIGAISILYTRSEFSSLMDNITDILVSPNLDDEQKRQKVLHEAKNFETANPGVIKRILDTDYKQIADSIMYLNLVVKTLEGGKNEIGQNVIINSILANIKNNKLRNPRGAALIPFYLLHKTGYSANFFAKYFTNDINLGTPTSPFSEGTRANPIVLNRHGYEVTGFPNFFIKRYLLVDKKLSSVFEALKVSVENFGKDILDLSKLLRNIWYSLSVEVRRVATPDRLKDAYDDFLNFTKKYVDDGLLSNTLYNNVLVKQKQHLVNLVSDPDSYDELIDNFVDELYMEILTNQPIVYESGVVRIKADSKEKLIKIAEAIDESPEAYAFDVMADLLNFCSSCIDLFLLPANIKQAASGPQSSSNPTPNPQPTSSSNPPSIPSSNPQSTPSSNPQSTSIVPSSGIGGSVPSSVPTVGQTQLDKLIEILKTTKSLANALQEMDNKKARLSGSLYDSLQKLVQISNYFMLFVQHDGELQAILHDFVPKVLDTLFGITTSFLEYGKMEERKFLPETQKFLDKLLSDIMDWSRSVQGKRMVFSKLAAAVDSLIVEKTKEEQDLISKIQNTPSGKERDALIEKLNEVKAIIFKLKKVLPTIVKIIRNPNTVINPQELEEIVSVTGFPLEEYISAPASASPKVPGKAQPVFESLLETSEIDLKNLKVLEDKLHLDKELINEMITALTRIIELRGRLVVQTQNLVSDIPLTSAQLAEINGLIPLTPIAKRQLFTRVTNKVYLLSDGFIKFLKNKLPSKDYNDFVAEAILGLKEGRSRTTPKNVRLDILQKVLSVITKDYISLFSSDIATVYNLLGFYAGVSERDVQPVLEKVGKDVANKVFPIKKNSPTSILTKNKTLEKDIVRMLKVYLSNTMSNEGLMRTIFMEAVQYVQNQLGPQFTGDFSFQDILNSAYKKLELALKNPINYSSYVLPYTIKSDLMEVNLPSGSFLTINDLNQTYIELENFLNYRKTIRQPGKKHFGSIGNILNDLLSSGYYSNVLAFEVNRVLEKVLPDFANIIDAKDVANNFPADSFQKQNYGRDIDLYQITEYMSGFMNSFISMLIDCQIEVANNNISLHPGAPNSIHNYISKYINTRSKGGSFVLDMLVKHIAQGNLYNLEEAIETDYKILHSSVPTNTNQKIIIKTGAMSDLKQHIAEILKSFKPEFDELKTHFEKIDYLMTQSNNLSEEIYKLLKKLEDKYE